MTNEYLDKQALLGLAVVLGLLAMTTQADAEFGLFAGYELSMSSHYKLVKDPHNPSFQNQAQYLRDRALTIARDRPSMRLTNTSAPGMDISSFRIDLGPKSAWYAFDVDRTYIEDITTQGLSAGDVAITSDGTGGESAWLEFTFPADHPLGYLESFQFRPDLTLAVPGFGNGYYDYRKIFWDRGQNDTSDNLEVAVTFAGMIPLVANAFEYDENQINFRLYSDPANGVTGESYVVDSSCCDVGAFVLRKEGELIPTPEPSAMFLLLAGAGGLAVFGLRRRRLADSKKT